MRTQALGVVIAVLLIGVLGTGCPETPSKRPPGTVVERIPRNSGIELRVRRDGSDKVDSWHYLSPQPYCTVNSRWPDCEQVKST